MPRRSVARSEAPPLPADISGWHRKIKAERTINDLVEDIHLMMIEDKKYLALLRATHNAHAVEGSINADNIVAAIMIRERAKAINHTEIADAKLAEINTALGVALRRYGFARSQRRNGSNGGGQASPDE